MSKLQMSPFEFDSRMVEWNLRHNKITKDQLKTYLDSLPDEALNAETIQIEESEVNGASSSHVDHAGNGNNGSETY